MQCILLSWRLPQGHHQRKSFPQLAPSMSSVLARITPQALRRASLPRRIVLHVSPRYISHAPPHWNVSTPATNSPPVGVPSAEVQPERDDGDPMEIEEKEWENDDFTSSGHAELERHREARQYARITMYEMPRLSGTLSLPL